MICKNCHAEIDGTITQSDDGTIRCPACGYVYAQAEKNPKDSLSGASMPLRASRRRRPQRFYERQLWRFPVWLWGVAVVALIAIVVILFALLRRAPAEQPPAPIDTVTEAPAPTWTDTPATIAPDVTDTPLSTIAPAAPTVAPTVAPADTGSATTKVLGDYRVAVVDKRVQTKNGVSYLLVRYKWAHHSASDTSFQQSMQDTVTQDGVELEQFAPPNMDTKRETLAKRGQTVNVTGVYTLQNTTSPVTVSITVNGDDSGDALTVELPLG